MQMHRPPHPGEVIRELGLVPLKLSVTDAARALGVTRKALSELLNGRAGVSPAMALRLAKAFDTSPEMWLNLQQQYDLWRARAMTRLRKVRRLKVA
jgi:addiction module HigA family antidote